MYSCFKYWYEDLKKIEAVHPRKRLSRKFPLHFHVLEIRNAGQLPLLSPLFYFSKFHKSVINLSGERRREEKLNRAGKLQTEPGKERKKKQKVRPGRLWKRLAPLKSEALLRVGTLLKRWGRGRCNKTLKGVKKWGIQRGDGEDGWLKREKK